MGKQTLKELLKPCPFCGSKKLMMDTGLSGADDSKLFWIVCNECYSSGPAYDKKSAAIARWNKRVDNSNTRKCENCWVSPDDCNPLDCEMEKEQNENTSNS